jgi:hypothetical protein
LAIIPGGSLVPLLPQSICDDVLMDFWCIEGCPVRRVSFTWWSTLFWMQLTIEFLVQGDYRASPLMFVHVLEWWQLKWWTSQEMLWMQLHDFPSFISMRVVGDVHHVKREPLGYGTWWRGLRLGIHILKKLTCCK